MQMSENAKDKEVYILRLTREQENIIERACELFARLCIGQFNQIPYFLMDNRIRVDDWCRRRDDATEALRLAACIIFGRNQYGDPDCQKTDDHMRAWEVYEVLRYHRCWNDNPEGGWGVCFDKPMSLRGEPLPKCMIEKGGVIVDDGSYSHGTRQNR